MVILTVVVVLLLGLVGYHARLEWVEGLADYLCSLVRMKRCPPRLAPVLSVLAVSLIGLPLIGAVIAYDDYRFHLLAWAAGGFLGDIFSTHIIPTWITGRRSPALSTWWAYILVGGGLVIYLWLHSFHPLMFVVGIISFVGLWPLMLGLRAVIR
jgi:hypothetical protein